MDNELGSIETEMKRGFLQLLVLVLLEKDAYGYAMVRAFRDLGYEVEENTLYPLLRRLEKRGLVQGKWELSEERPRKFYAVTDGRPRDARRAAGDLEETGRDHQAHDQGEQTCIRTWKPISRRSAISSRAARSGRRSWPRSAATSWRKPSRKPARSTKPRWKRSSPPTASRAGWPKNTWTAGRSSPRPSSATSSAIPRSSSPSTSFSSSSP